MCGQFDYYWSNSGAQTLLAAMPFDTSSEVLPVFRRSCILETHACITMPARSLHLFKFLVRLCMLAAAWCCTLETGQCSVQQEATAGMLV